MKVTPTALPGVLIVDPDVFGDARGFFLETWSHARYAAAGMPVMFVQDNLSYSGHGILRGLHLQHPHAQGKLVSVVAGEVYDVAVDVRRGSPTFGQWVGMTLSGDNKRQMYIPPGFAHGFCVTGPDALFSYKCTQPYHREAELGVSWSDPDIGIVWPVASPRLSEKDAEFPRLADIEPDRLPPYSG